MYRLTTAVEVTLRVLLIQILIQIHKEDQC